MADDLDAFLTQSTPSAAPGATSAGTPDPATDLAVRTAYIEAGNQPPVAQQAVISTAVNRAKALGQPLQSVILAPGQYSAWSDPRLVARAEALSPSDPAYKAIASTIAPVLNGEVTTPYTNYLNRSATPAGSPALTSWAAKPGVKIGDQEFYALPVNGDGSPRDLDSFLGGAPTGEPSGASGAFLSGIGASSAQPASAATPAAPIAPAPTTAPASAAFLKSIASADDSAGGVDTPTGLLFTDGSAVTSQKLANAYLAFSKTKDYDPKAAPGSEAHPYGQKVDVAPVPGAWYIGTDGSRFQATPADAAAYSQASKQEQLASAGGATFNGLLQGFAPEVTGAARYIASGGDPRAYAQGANAAQAQLDAYRAAHPLVAGLAQGGGSLVTGALGTEGLGAIAGAARVPELLGPAGEFLSGTAGASGAADASIPSITRNMLLQSGSKVANAGLQGAAIGAISSHLNPDTPIAEQIGLGAAGGALLGGAGQLARGAGNLLMRNPAIADTVNSFTQPLTAEGRDAIVNRAIQSFADGGPTAVDASELVPGSTPTLATATGNRGLMAAEKALRATPEGANVFGARDVSNANAQSNALEALRGDNDSLQALIDARDAATSPLREAAFANATPVDPTPVSDKIDEILASPAGKRDAVAKVLNNIKGKLTGADGEPETDPEQLYGVRQAIGDMYSSDDASSARLANKELGQVKSSLDDVIESGSPGFKDYLKTFADASGPVNEQQFLLGRSLTDRNDQPTLAKIKTTLDAIQRGQMASGANAAKSVSSDTIDALRALRDDLVRGDLTPDRNIRSDTVQNLASNALLAKASIPTAVASFHLPGVGFARNALSALYDAQNPKITNLLLAKMLDPELGATAFQPATPNPSGGNLLLRAISANAADDYGSNRRRPALMAP